MGATPCDARALDEQNGCSGALVTEDQSIALESTCSDVGLVDQLDSFVDENEVVSESQATAGSDMPAEQASTQGEQVDGTAQDTDSDALDEIADVTDASSAVSEDESSVTEEKLTEATGESDESSKPDTETEEQAEQESIADDNLSAQATAENGVALPAGATTVKEGTYFFEVNVADNKVLGVTDSKPTGHTEVKSVTFNGSNSQKWVVQLDSATGWYYILLKGTSTPLALGKAKTSDRLELLYPDVVGDRALWAFVKDSSWFHLVNRSMPDCFLAVAKGSKAEGAALAFEDSSVTGAGRRYYLVDPNPQVAAGDTITEGAYSVAYSQNSKIAADVKGASSADNTNVILYTYGDRLNEKFYLESNGKGYYTAWVLGTGKVLAQQSSAVIPGTNVVQKSYVANSATQLWALRHYSDGTYSLVNKATGLALGAAGNKSGSNLVGTRNDGYKTTRFNLTRRAILTAGIVEIHPRTNSKVSVDVEKAVSSGTANLLLWVDGNKLNQRFEMVSAGSTDLWRIRSASSGGWITTNSSGVQQSGKGADAKTNANTWLVTFKGGWYSLVNKATGKALDMPYGKTSNGTKLITFTPNGRDSQHFTFKKVDLIDAGFYALQNGNSRYLTVNGSSRADGANINVNKRTGAASQVFIFAKSGSSWKIRNAASGLYLTAASTRAGANVSQKSGGTNKTQLWTLAITDGGGIAIKSVANPKLQLNATNNGKANGDNVTVATAATAAYQRWKPVTILKDGTLTAKQKKVVAAAKSTPSPGYGYCAGWVTNVFQNAGIGSWYGDACDQYNWFCKSADLTALKPGMIVAVRSHNKTYAGSIWGHVGIYVGGGKLMDNVGSIRTISIFDWIEYYGEVVTPKWGWFGTSLV